MGRLTPEDVRSFLHSLCGWFLSEHNFFSFSSVSYLEWVVSFFSFQPLIDRGPVMKIIWVYWVQKSWYLELCIVFFLYYVVEAPIVVYYRKKKDRHSTRILHTLLLSLHAKLGVQSLIGQYFEAIPVEWRNGSTSRRDVITCNSKCCKIFYFDHFPWIPSTYLPRICRIIYLWTT